MAKTLRLAFIYSIDEGRPWMDGLWAALNLLEEDFKITRINLTTTKGKYDFSQFDFVLGWGAFGSPADHFIQSFKLRNPKRKTGLCIAGNAYPPEGINNYDVLFYETKWYRDQIKHHPNIVHAFGVNTDIFNKIDIPTPIVWDYIGVGAFAKWKRWRKMIDKPGKKLVIGQFQKGNPTESVQIIRELITGGVMVSDEIDPIELSWFYHLSRTQYIPADLIGGGERSILEARACGLKVEVEEDNPKLKELVECELKDHYYYAKQLKDGIKEAL